MGELTQDALVEAVRRAAQRQNGIISKREFERITGISDYHISRLFPEGGWTEVLRLAEVAPHPRRYAPVSDDDILAEYHRVASELGDPPTWAVFDARSRLSASLIRRRFGGLQGTLREYRAWLEQHDPASPLLERLQAHSKHEIPPPPAPTTGPAAKWQQVPGSVYGAPISFRGLRHAPVNEQGVVYLFGMVSYELGFLVEAVHSSYPDCEAKRCIDSKRDRWQRVRIEFEFRSAMFKEHGHDPTGCDLIVCWIHDWPDCPLEVLELRRVIDDLQG